MKEKDKTPEKGLSKVEKSNALNNDFTVVIIKMLNDLRRRMDVHNENFKRVRKQKEEPNRAEEYNNWNKKHTRRNQK